MSSDKKGAVKLSDGWMLCTSKSNPGRKYYFNKRTGKSSWTQPQVNFVIFLILLVIVTKLVLIDEGFKNSRNCLELNIVCDVIVFLLISRLANIMIGNIKTGKRK